MIAVRVGPGLRVAVVAPMSPTWRSISKRRRGSIWSGIVA